MTGIVETVAAYIEQHQLFPIAGTVVVAVSGGADSLCLLHVLRRLCGPERRYPGVELHVAHLNHMMRGEASAQDAEFVEKIASEWNLPFAFALADIPRQARDSRRSLEDVARMERYEFLGNVALGLESEHIAVAHHMDDQAETLLLHLLRGGGIGSMVGLQPRQRDIIRPLLCITHADAVDYCHEQQIPYHEDESNTDPRFLRNRIRHELLPLLESLNPGIRGTLIHNAEAIRPDVDWIEAQVDACWEQVVEREVHARSRLGYFVLRRLPLLALSLSIRRHLLRRITAYMSNGQSSLELRHYQLIEAFLQRDITAGPASFDLPDAINLYMNRDLLLFSKTRSQSTELSTQQDVRWIDLKAPLLADSPILADARGAILNIPGLISMYGMMDTIQADLVEGDELVAVRHALEREDWDEVWRILGLVERARHTVYIDRARIGKHLLVRTRRPGDRMRPLGMQHEKKIQDILVDKRLPRPLRDSLPIFFTEEHCVWLPGIYPDDRVRLTRETKNIVRLIVR